MTNAELDKKIDKVEKDLKGEICKVDSKLEKFITNDFHHLSKKFDWILGLHITTLVGIVTGMVLIILNCLS